MLSRKSSASQIMDNLQIVYKENGKAIQECVKLAQLVRDSILSTKEKGHDQSQLMLINTILLKKHKDMLFVKCRELNISQEEYLRQLVFRDLKLNPFSENEEIKKAKVIKKGR
jgi:hypothetical protein